MTRSSDRTISKWILPHSPAPNALPRFQSGRFCYEVNWKRGGSDDLNIEFLGALVLAVQATQVCVALNYIALSVPDHLHG